MICANRILNVTFTSLRFLYWLVTVLVFQNGRLNHFFHRLPDLPFVILYFLFILRVAREITHSLSKIYEAIRIFQSINGDRSIRPKVRLLAHIMILSLPPFFFSQTTLSKLSYQALTGFLFLPHKLFMDLSHRHYWINKTSCKCQQDALRIRVKERLHSILSS